MEVLMDITTILGYLLEALLEESRIYLIIFITSPKKHSNDLASNDKSSKLNRSLSNNCLTLWIAAIF
jgi:hypothetical protein